MIKKSASDAATSAEIFCGAQTSSWSQGAMRSPRQSRMACSKLRVNPRFAGLRDRRMRVSPDARDSIRANYGWTLAPPSFEKYPRIGRRKREPTLARVSNFGDPFG